jgi:cellulose synthase/poly-beta-1,6-N-acetylglucosamine synthase-like glycosyltransferase
MGRPAASSVKTADPKAAKAGWRPRVRRFLSRRRRPQSIPWGSFLAVIVIAVLMPLGLDVFIGARDPKLIRWLHWLVSTVYAVTSVMIVWEACAAWREAETDADADVLPLPRCTAVIAAYLPNEQDIILDTLAHMLATLDVPPGDLEVILAYNTPETLEIETDLHALAARDSRVRLLRVAGSVSKAENVNAALQVAGGEIVAVYDADHLPAADCFRKAWRWLASGYDMVQGRCVIRNEAQNLLTRIVGVEFDTMYALSHQGRSGLSRTAIFGGSNGYWRRSALRDTPMNAAMLTEDIDVSVRSLIAGRKLVHDRSIISEELAPTRLKHWISQRKRWSQGWLEVTLRHQRDLMETWHLSAGQKVLWFYLLGWRECYPFLSVQVAPLIAAAWILGEPIHWFGNPYFVGTSIVTLASGPFALLITYLRCGRSRRGRAARYLLYGMLGLFYTSLKTLVTLVAQYSHFLRDRQWVTTPREIS